MSRPWRSAALIAIVLFFGLWAARFALAPTIIRVTDDGGQIVSQVFDQGRKNYASVKIEGPPAIGAAQAQKYEKIAFLGQTTSAFESDRAKLLASITAHTGQIQVERASGLAGRRSLALGIGVPPDRFDAFVVAVQSVGRSTRIEVVKNDKTNEYLRLRAERTTLEQTRGALQGLVASGGSIDERINLVGRIADVEQKLQALGVSLGEFDQQNELCTVRVTLAEARPTAEAAWGWRALDALQWTVLVYAGLAIGLSFMTGGLWVGMMVVRAVRGAA
jgi:hypothetical protein